MKASEFPLVFLYGPPGSGKSTLGRRLGEALHLPFWDLDAEVESRLGRSISEVFREEGETGFRAHEREIFASLCGRGEGVVALGGGTLLDPQSWALAESAGVVLCLHAPLPTLLDRLDDSTHRPLLMDGQGRMSGGRDGLEQRLRSLLEERHQHYASFPRQVVTSQDGCVDPLWEAQVLLGWFRVRGMGHGYDVRLLPGGLDRLGAGMQKRDLPGPVALVSDQTAFSFYGQRAESSLQAAGYAVYSFTFPPGEQQKTLATVQAMWDRFLAAGLERSSPVVALGGGVVGDLAGFAAATFLRGVPWIAVPTTLLAMVDASLGGKTAVDLPQGKNLVGAFHPPRLVLVDPQALATLPQTELRSGMAEVVKAGLIGDAQLFRLCAQGWEQVKANWPEILRRAMAVKIRIIEDDPFETGQRAALNLGHTLGHALESASGFELRHGEAVSIGLVGEARLAERLGLAESGLSEAIATVLEGLGLPTKIPASIDRRALCKPIVVDKKRAGGRVRFALPERVGSVQTSVQIPDLEQWLAEL